MERFTVVEKRNAAARLPESRASMERRLAAAEAPFALMVFAPEGLKGVNRIHGHQTGDRLIAAFVKAVTGVAADDVCVAHLEGAKFCLLTDASDAHAAEDFVDSIRRAVEAVSADGVISETRAGLCWCAAPQGGKAQAEEALSSALASFDAAAAGVAPKTYVLDVSEDANDMALARFALGAVRSGAASIALQPVVDAEGSGRVLFREALIRTPGPNGGSMAAGRFMPTLDRLAMTEEVDIEGLRLAFDELSAYPALRISVNMSAASLAGRRWLETFESLARRSPDCAERLIVEVSEEAALEDAGASTGVFALIRALGAALALDDFGAGRTSFRQLRDFRFDMVKIDGAFIQNIDSNADNQMLVSALVGIARQFDMMVVAEFVETASEARMLRSLGVDGFQGFLFGKPSLVWSREDGVGVAGAS